MNALQIIHRLDHQKRTHFTQTLKTEKENLVTENPYLSKIKVWRYHFEKKLTERVTNSITKEYDDKIVHELGQNNLHEEIKLIKTRKEFSTK